MAVLNGIDLNLLKAFHAIYELRNVTRAAERLGLTQPAVSRSLQRLRLSFSDPLFEWIENEMRPTALAQAIAPLVASCLSSAEEAFAQAAGYDPATATTEFRIGMTDYISTAILPHLLEHLRREAPFTTFITRPVPAFDIGPALRRGLVSHAFVSSCPAEPDIESRGLFRDDYVIVADRFRGPAVEGVLPLDLYTSHRHVLVSYGGTRVGWVDHQLEKLGRTRLVTTVVHAFAAVPEIITGTSLVSTVPRRIALHFAKLYPLRMMELPFASDELHFHLAWRRTMVRTPALAWIDKMIGEVCARLDRQDARP